MYEVLERLQTHNIVIAHRGDAFAQAQGGIFFYRATWAIHQLRLKEPPFHVATNVMLWEYKISIMPSPRFRNRTLLPDAGSLPSPRSRQTIQNKAGMRCGCAHAWLLRQIHSIGKIASPANRSRITMRGAGCVVESD
ncbi:MAG: hypothetical protein ABJM43_22565 [Paracoccaceae bacterium]